jgi:hypothetical protein
VKALGAVSDAEQHLAPMTRLPVPAAEEEQATGAHRFDVA